MLREFYMVTSSPHTCSLYHVRAGHPSAKKIAMKGRSKIALGDEIKIGEKFAICARLVAYNREAPGLPICLDPSEEVYMVWFSSLIVALFFTEEDARACFVLESLTPCDPGFEIETRAVCDAIEEDHPDFFVCKKPGLCLRIFEEENEDGDHDDRRDEE